MMAQLTEWMTAHWMILLAASAATFLVSIIAVPVLIVRLPADYFSAGRKPDSDSSHPVLRVLFRVLKNILGVCFLVGGFIMLFTPGQGVLSILLGVVLMDFPGKRRIERGIISRPRVLGLVNVLRKKAGRPPFVLD